MIAIFDLDETLIHGDCVTLWCQWLCEQGLVQDVDAFLQEEIRLMDAYKAKTLDQQDCMNHVFAPIVHLQINEVQALVAQFVRAKILPIVYQAGLRLIQEHYDNSDDVIIISASPRIFVEEIARTCFNVDKFFGIEVAEENGYHTGEIQGLIPYQAGKVSVFKDYLDQHNIAIETALQHSYFYSDSSNDLPLLEIVAYPNVVNPDASLRAVAEDKDWPILEFTRLLVR